jgi:DNA topoisomerase-1
VEYWTIHGEFRSPGSRQSFLAKLIKVDDEDIAGVNDAGAQVLAESLRKASFQVTKVRRSERRRRPSPPFTTSTLQQDASRKLGFPAKRTMALAQGLYEGQDVGNGGLTGLITYMRTDSPQVAESAQQDAREFISQKYGADFVPAEPPEYKSRSANAQEAHEAIRPTSVGLTPESVKGFLEPPMYRLYNLIWQRFVASQMEAAVYDTLQVEVTGALDGHDYLLRASGSTVRFPGFLAVYEEARSEEAGPAEEEDEAKIPAGIAEGQPQELVRAIPEQHFTQPPPRLSEASLVQALEENGIGRPSTYAPTISTIQQRGYVERVEKRLAPTEIGFQINDLLVEYFPEVVDVKFTAHMEDDLDKVAAGEMEWTAALREFYDPFKELVRRAQAEIPITKTGPEPIGRKCPEDGGELVVRYGRYGRFISCANFPLCRYTEPWLEKIGVSCPKDGGDIVERKTRKGRVFYGCANYPACDFTSWKRPVANPCPNCGGLLVVANKRELQCTKCERTFSAEEVLPESASE